MNKFIKGEHRSIATEFKKGQIGYWLGKKRPNLKKTNASKTMFKKGIAPWNKGTKGLWHPTEETRGRMSIASKGRLWTEEHKKMTSQKLTGRKLSEETIQKIILTRKRGKDNHLWRGGITKINSIISGCGKYQRWRSMILERDNYKCVMCGSDENLEVDHIKMLALIIKEYNIKNILQAYACKELWDLNNGRTLCKDCHKKTETYGINGKRLIYNEI